MTHFEYYSACLISESYRWGIKNHIVAPLKVLASIAAEKGNMAVLFDGGIRRGTDIIKALAVGADFIFVGRPFLYGAALYEEAGVTHVINLLSEEIDRNVALLGCSNLNELASRIIS